ncbi:MAG: TRAP transporter substrate-binding protein DctP [Micrococcaceae bacterium]|nr:TRAP transporter substrate-binding protein DctP [Micrococcaceae bacterium]
MTTTKPSKRLRGSFKGIAVAAVTALSLSACAQTEAQDGAEEFNFVLANGAQVGTPHEAVQDRYLEMIEERTDGRVTFDRTDFEVLCSLDEIAECVSDGRADIGTTITDYTPHMLPSMSVTSIIGMNTDMQAAISAMYDVHNEYEPAKQDLEDNNLHLASAWPVGTLFLGSQEPVDNLDDVDGLQARAAGPVTQQVLQDAGMNISAITAAETYEALQRGVIDSVASALDFAVQYAVAEQAPYWTDPGLGQYTSYGMWWNKDAYESLPEDLQATVDEVTDELNYGEAMNAYNERIDEVCQSMIDSPDVENFDRWDDAEAERWNNEIGDRAEELWVDVVSEYNFENPDEYLAAYKEHYNAHESNDNVADGAAECVDRWQEQNG